MNLYHLFIALFLYTLGQTLVWYQTHAQFINEWARNHPLILSLIGIPVSFIYIYGNMYAYQAYGNVVWAGRLSGFAIGMIVMALLTFIHIDEPINIKTAVTLVLSFIIVLIQIFWKVQ